MSDFGQHRGSGWIECIFGSVSAGKSEEAIRRARRALIAKRKVQAFKPVIDDRYGGIHKISSHGGASIDAIPVSNAYEILSLIDADTQVVLIDEVQFFDDILPVAGVLADSGKRVICSGLDQDYMGRTFGPAGDLMAAAERVDKLQAICVCCGEPASRTQRLLDGKPAEADGPVILVGGLDPNAARFSYEARCRACHVVPTPHSGQLDMVI